jgi:hypothetical protein
MLNLAVPVTPPKPGSEAAEMSPAQFIVCSPTRDSVKRKERISTTIRISIERLRHSTSAICGKIGENKDTVSQVD